MNLTPTQFAIGFVGSISVMLGSMYAAARLTGYVENKDSKRVP